MRVRGRERGEGQRERERVREIDSVELRPVLLLPKASFSL